MRCSWVSYRNHIDLKSSHLTEEEKKDCVEEQIVPVGDDRRVVETAYSKPEAFYLCLVLCRSRNLQYVQYTYKFVNITCSGVLTSDYMYGVHVSLHVRLQ